jgi:hypothetical protein
MGYIVGLCGYGQAGKDTAARHMPGWTRAAFGDEMRRDLETPLARIYELGRKANLPEETIREIARPAIISFAEGVRKIDPRHWVDRLWPKLPAGNVIITDVRNVYEVERILDPGPGRISLGIIYIQRPWYGPASQREAETIQEIRERWRGMFPTVINDGTPEELGANVMDLVSPVLVED